MKQKTAMMELIEVLEDFANQLDTKDDGDYLINCGVEVAIIEAINRLEKEKEQIIDAFDYGSNCDDREYAEKYYYNSTYKQD